MLASSLFSSRRRHTRYWRDWSSDVCSSDLLGQPPDIGFRPQRRVDELASFPSLAVVEHLEPAGCGRRHRLHVAHDSGVTGDTVARVITQNLVEGGDLRVVTRSRPELKGLLGVEGGNRQEQNRQAEHKTDSVTRLRAGLRPHGSMDFPTTLIKAVKGTRDLLPPATEVWNGVEAAARAVFRAYNYHEIRTPIFEETQLFARGVGEETDIVTKEMYTFEDRDGSSLTLRPENTASVIRAYIEHRLDQRPGVQKLYYLGPMFRRERPQKGRYRQFYQIGAEAIGSESPGGDAEVIEMVVEILKRVGLAGFELLINSVGDHNCRPQYVERLRQELKSVAPQMCSDCQRRAETNPLRVLDCKAEADQPIIEKLPSIVDHLCETCRLHFDAVKQSLADRGIPYQVRPRLVRGLDYYMRTTFEVVHGSLGAQNSVLGGGRYA